MFLGRENTPFSEYLSVSKIAKIRMGQKKVVNYAAIIFVAHIVVIICQLLPPVGRHFSFVIVGNSMIGVLAAWGLARRGFERWGAFGLIGVISTDVYASIIDNALLSEIADVGATVNVFLIVSGLIVIVLTGVLLDLVWLLRLVLSASLITLFVHLRAIHALNAPHYLLWASITHMGAALTICFVFWLIRTRKPYITGRVRRFHRSGSKITFTLEQDDGTVVRGQVRLDNDSEGFSVNDQMVIDRYIRIGVNKDGHPEIEVLKFQILRSLT